MPTHRSRDSCARRSLSRISKRVSLLRLRLRRSKTFIESMFGSKKAEATTAAATTAAADKKGESAA